MKKTIAFLLVLAIVLSLVACASKKSIYPQTPEEAREWLIEAYRNRDAEKLYLVEGIDFQATLRNEARVKGDSLETAKSRLVNEAWSQWRSEAINEFINSLENGKIHELVGTEKKKALDLFSNAFASIYGDDDITAVSIIDPEDIQSVFYLDYNDPENNSIDTLLIVKTDKGCFIDISVWFYALIHKAFSEGRY